MPKLKIKNGVKAGKTLTLPEGPATLGRGPQNNFIIADDSISTQHLLIVSGRNLCRIKDRGSSNGTFVNGEPVTNADLKQGDVLRCGDIEMVVDMEAVEGQVPGRPPPPKRKQIKGLSSVGLPGAGKPDAKKKAPEQKVVAGMDYSDLEQAPETRKVNVVLPVVPILFWCAMVFVIVAGAWQLLKPKRKEVKKKAPAPQPVLVESQNKVERVDPGYALQDGPPKLPYDVTPGPAFASFAAGFTRLASEAGSAQAALDQAQPGDAIVFDRDEIEKLVIDLPLTNIQFIGGSAEWTVNADLVECQFFWHKPERFEQAAGKMEKCAFYRSHSPAMRLQHTDAVSFYHGGERVDPGAGSGNAQVEFTGFTRGVTIHKPVIASSDAEPRWDMDWPPVYRFDSAETNSPGHNSYILSPLVLGQTAWTPFHIRRGVGITAAHLSTFGGTWANPVIDIDYGIDCVLLATAFGGRSAAHNNGYNKEPQQLKYANGEEPGHNNEFAPYRGAVARVGGLRNRLIGIGTFQPWSVGLRANVPGMHYADGIVARDPFLQEWSSDGVALTMNFAPPMNVFKLDWSYRMALDTRNSSSEKGSRFPMLGPNVYRPVFVPLQDARVAPPVLDGKKVEDFTGREARDIERALAAGKYVFIGEGAYEFRRTITNGLVFGAGMDRTMITWPENIDCANRNCAGLIGLTVSGGRYGYNSQAGAGGLTNTANALILRTRFQDQKESGINAHAFEDQIYQDCEFSGCKNGITQGRVRGTEFWQSQRGRRKGRALVRLNVLNCRFRRMGERAIDLVMRDALEGVVGIHNSVFEECPGQAIRIAGGRSHLIQGCEFRDIGQPGSTYPAVQIAGQGVVVASHLAFLNIADSGSSAALAIDGYPTISHCEFGGFSQPIVARNPLTVDNCQAEEADIDLAFGSYVFMSKFANADVSKGVMEVTGPNQFKSVSLNSKVQPLDDTPPSAVTQIVVRRTDEGNEIRWNAANDPDSGILRYLVYTSKGEYLGATDLTMDVAAHRGNPLAGPLVPMVFVDPDPQPRQYKVVAVNGSNLIREQGQAPLPRWGPIRGVHHDTADRRLGIKQVRYLDRKRGFEVETMTLRRLSLNQLKNRGIASQLVVQEPFEEPTVSDQ